jgi:hypothetical protein
LKDFVFVHTGEDVEFAACQGRGGIGLADGHFPFLVEFLGPGCGRGETGDFVVPIWPAPLGPILRGRGSGEDNGNQAGEKRNSMSSIIHSVSFVGLLALQLPSRAPFGKRKRRFQLSAGAFHFFGFPS